MRFLTRTLAISPLLAAFLSCGFQVGDIDRTQPNKVRKSIFQGDWYYRQTVLGVPYTTSLTFTGEQNDPTEMIQWDVQEKFLVAYRAYDRIAGTDHAANFGGSAPPAVPVAIFPIESHFDIKRDYNAETGEQNNVITENTEDRPWNERTYVRVDWSQNLAASFDFVTSAVTLTPGSHYVQEPGNLDAVLLARRDGDGWEEHQGAAITVMDSADYIDVVHRVFATPEMLQLDDGYGGTVEEPACWYYGTADCASGELRIRSAFLKRQPSSYVPLDYPDNAVLRDANGNPIRVSYKDVDSLEPDPAGAVARAQYFDKFGYFRTERDAYDRLHGETNTGRITLINRFNIWKDTPGCVDASSATPYARCTVKPIVYHLSPGFPADMKPAAQETTREWNEAFKLTVRALKYGDERPLDQVEDVFFLKDNTWREEGGTTVDRGQRVGDLRYNLMAWVDEANQAGLLGYGPSTQDPLTGETINASAFIYGASVDFLAQRGKEMIDLLNDPNQLPELLLGEDVSRDIFLRNSKDENAIQRTGQFIRERLDTSRVHAIHNGGKQRLKTDGTRVRSRLAALKDTPLEQRLMPDPIVRAMQNTRPSNRGGANADPRVSSPRAWAMGRRDALEKQRRLRLALKKVEPWTSFDPSLVGIAHAMKDRPAETVYQELRVAIFKSTLEHEVGHTLGLRHNFEGTSDALNYGRAYWDLRGANGHALDAPTQAQLDGRMREHQYSSIMDYGARFMSDIQGLGLYDKAAIAFGYGGLVETFPARPDEPLLEVATLDGVLRHWRHYTKQPNMFGGIEAMHNRKLVPYARIVEQLAGRADWTLWEVPYRFCSDEYEGATATCAVYDEGPDAYEMAMAARSLYRDYVPFLAFSRDRRDFNEWDYMDRIMGRTLRPMLTQYQNWVFNRFGDESAWDCVRSDMDECDYQDGVDAEYYGIADVPWVEAEDGGLPGAAATRLLLDLLSEMVATPEPGTYYMDTDEQALLLADYAVYPRCQDTTGDEACGDAAIPGTIGRRTDSSWEFDSGYYFYDRLQSVGSFYDKLLAIETAVTSDTYFVGVDTGSDVSRYLIGLSLYFPEEIYRLVGGVAAEDYGNFAGVVCDSNGAYEPPVLSQAMPTRCNGGTFKVVDPATSFTVELYSIWYGMAFLPMAFDTAFTDRTKIWIEGSGEAITPTDPSLLVTFVNPLNNRTYHASRSPLPGSYNPGAQLLARAQRFADAYRMDPSETNRYLVENLVSTIEDVRGTFAIYGTLTF